MLGKTAGELSDIAARCGLRPFVGRQIARWLYVSKVTSWDAMTNVSKDAKARLQAEYELGTYPPEASVRSSDGTVKYLFKVGESDAVEAVMIPDGERRTLCVSSQAGCRMGCRFCMTGRQGWHGNLDTAQILNQMLSVPESAALTNVVFMGMGEPLDNWAAVSRAIRIMTAEDGFAWSPKRITLSTIGVLPNLRRCLDELDCHIALSLHNPFPDERLEMMPAQKAWPVADAVAMLRAHGFSGQRRVSFEYTMFDGWNDSKRHADALIRLLSGLECRVNLIRFHEIPDFPYHCSPVPRMEEFRDRLNNHGLLCTIRASRGEDILAACGMLAGRH